MAKGCMAVPRGCHPQKANISVSGRLQIVDTLISKIFGRFIFGHLIFGKNFRMKILSISDNFEQNFGHFQTGE